MDAANSHVALEEDLSPVKTWSETAALASTSLAAFKWDSEMENLTK